MNMQIDRVVRFYAETLADAGLKVEIHIVNATHSAKTELLVSFQDHPGASILIEVDPLQIQRGRDYIGEFLKFFYNANPDYKMAIKFKEVMKWAVK
jgi:hypothetical protein